MKKLILPLLLMLSIQAIAQHTCRTRTTLSEVTYTGAHDFVITADSISSTHVGAAALTLTNCYNVTIIDNIFDANYSGLNDPTQVARFGIHLNNCHDITIRHNLIKNGSTNVYVEHCGANIKIDSNEMKNAKGPYPRGAHVQFNDCNGAGLQITYNVMENISGQSYPEDNINVYKSNGTSSSWINVQGNKIRGGGPSVTGSGVTIGDQGGSYIKAQNNTVVNSGYIGMQIAGGNHISIINNTIYSAAFAWSHLGLGAGNYSGLSYTDWTVSGNSIKWVAGITADLISGLPQEKDVSYHHTGDPQSVIQPTGWLTNTLNASITTSILPVNLFVNCTIPVLSPPLSVGYIRNDTVKITNKSKSAVLALETATKDTTGGFAKNVVKGIIEFHKIQKSDLPASGATPGSYTNPNVTVDNKGRVTAISNGTGGGGGIDPNLSADLVFKNNGHVLGANNSFTAGTGLGKLRTSIYFGDSVTDGYVASVTDHRWSSLTSGYLHDIEDNKAIVGSCMETTIRPGYLAMVDRLAEIPHYNVNTSDYIFYMYGINDASFGGDSTTFYNNYLRVIDTTIARGWPLNRIVVMGSTFQTGSNEAATQPLIRQASRAATLRGVYFVNTDSYMSTHGGAALLGDPNHPNNAGHAVVVQSLVTTVPLLGEGLVESNFYTVGRSMKFLNLPISGVYRGVISYDTAGNTYGDTLRYARQDGGSTWAVGFGVNTFTATLVPGITSYRMGLAVNILFQSTNSASSPTLNLNGLGAKPLVRIDGTAMQAGDIYANKILALVYDGTSFQAVPSLDRAGGLAGGDLIGNYPNPTINAINAFPANRYDPTSSIQTQLNSKVSISAPQLLTSSTINYVWTATDALGHGSWQVASGGGSGSPSGSTNYIQITNGTSFGSDLNFQWDLTNHRLNIGQPDASLQFGAAGIVGVTCFFSGTSSSASRYYINPNNTTHMYIGADGIGPIISFGYSGGVRIGSSSGVVSAGYQLQVDGATKLDGVITLKGYTVSGLPGSPHVGDIAYVTDASSPVIGNAVASGGSAYAGVNWNGSQWTVFSK